MNESVHEIIRQAQQNYVHGTTKLGDHVSWSMHDTIERITAYLNSKHTTGDKDSLGREKPFFNIVSAVVNIWYRATDIDRKDIIVRADKQANFTLSFFANALLQDWMRRERFGVFLNQWGRELAKYGSAVVKFVKKNGELIPSSIPWNRLICDPVDFEALPRIEKLYKTPAQLRKIKEYDQNVVENLIKSASTRKTLSGDQQDEQNDFIELYEVHGELPIGLLKADPQDNDWKEYRQQVHVVSYTSGKTQGTYDDFTLYRGKEAEDPYMITHLIEEAGRTLSIGAVEYLFDAQWMQNHTMKNLKDTLDLSSKLIFQTADNNYVGRNVLSSIQTGDILNHKENMPLTQINTGKADVTALQNFSNQWKVLEQELTATPEAARGVNPPSGTPYSTTAALLAQNNSLFALMIQNKGLAIEDMLRKWIIPHLKTKMDNQDEIMALMKDHDIKRLDAIYIPNEAIKQYNEMAKEQILNEQIPPSFQEMKLPLEQGIQQGLSQMGNSRPFSPGDVNWKEALKDLEWELEVGVTSEPNDKTAVAQTLTTLLQTLVQPGIQQNPTAMAIIGKILNLTGAMSAIEIPAATEVQPPQPELAGNGRMPVKQ